MAGELGFSNKSSVIMLPSFAVFPESGSSGFFYLDLSSGEIYYWDGTSYNLTAGGGGGSGPTDTDGLPEGATNLYYTDGRVDSRIGLTDLGDLADVRNTVANTDDILAWSGSQWQATNLEDIALKQYTLLLDEISSTVSYIGEALPGSLQEDPVWRIKKLDEGGTPPLQIEWADGTSDFDKVWDDRATYTYS